MTNEQFNAIAEHLLQNTANTLIKKASEYSMDTDRLSNFKQAARLQRCTPEQALQGYLTKHIISIYDRVTYAQDFPLELAEEKIGDTINYLILLYALLAERAEADKIIKALEATDESDSSSRQ